MFFRFRKVKSHYIYMYACMSRVNRSINKHCTNTTIVIIM